MLLSSVVLLPLATAFLTILLGHQPRWQNRVSIAGGVLFLLAALLLLQQVSIAHDPIRLSFGNWPAPFGIEFVADRLSAIMVLITALMGLAVLVYQLSEIEPSPPGMTGHALIHGLLAGVSGAFVTADLFNLYVWFEVMLIASLGLLAYGGNLKNTEATLKYFVLNVIGTLAFLAAVALIYAQTGHLNYTALALSLPQHFPASLVPVLGLLLLAFLVKAGVFPLYAWLPASYHTLPAPVLALFAGLLTKVGAYAVLRVMADIFPSLPNLFFNALGWLAVLTMITGVLGAAYHWDIRRILAFHIISQIGYILLAVALGTKAGYGAAVFYTIHHIIVKANLFLVAGLVFQASGSYDLRTIGGLAIARPVLGLVFLIPALSLVGIPPLSGFWAKLLVIREAMYMQHYVWFGSALLVGLLTLYSMMKIGMEVFWKQAPEGLRIPPASHQNPKRHVTAYAVVIFLAALTVWIGLWPETLLQFSLQAVEQMTRDQ